MKNNNVFDQKAALERARKQWELDNANILKAREVHAKALAEKERLSNELKEIEDLIYEFENDLESKITPSDFEKAIIRKRALSVEVRRAEALVKKEQHNWGEAERTRRDNARRARGEAERELNSVIDQMRAQFYNNYQVLM